MEVGAFKEGRFCVGPPLFLSYARTRAKLLQSLLKIKPIESQEDYSFSRFILYLF